MTEKGDDVEKRDVEKMGPVERELYERALEQEPFYTIAEAVRIGVEHKGPEKEQRIKSSIERAASPDRAGIKTMERPGYARLLVIDSFYAWLSEYEEREQASN
jgi:hypothetical protein